MTTSDLSVDWQLVARNVLYARSLQQLTRSELAERAGVNTSSLFRVEKGRTIRTQTLRKIADAMDIPLEWVLNNQPVAEKSYRFRRSQEDQWFAFVDHRPKLPADRFEAYQAAEERQRLGTLGFVPLFGSPGSGPMRLELFGLYTGPINHETHVKGTLYVLSGEIRAVVDGDELLMGEGDGLFYLCESLQALELRTPRKGGASAQLLWNGVEPIKRIRRSVRGKT
jgi:transcriptional regulator with XRE-family HTH domain